MKKLFFAAFAAISLFVAPAFAETAIGVVDVAKIMKESKAATSARNQIQSKQKAFQSDLDAKEKALYSEDQALVKEREKSEKEAFNAKVKAFREKAAKEQRSAQEKKVALDRAFTNSLEEIQKNVLEIVKQIATEKKLNIVLSSSQVLYSDEAINITDEVLKRLDSKLPNVSVKF